MFVKFKLTGARHISAANRNVYVSPVLHPNRKLKEHDLIYVTQGEWEIAVGEEVFVLKKDHVLILPSRIPHRGVRPCLPNTSTLFIMASEETGDAIGTRQPSTGIHDIAMGVYIDAAGYPEVKDCFVKIIEAKMADNDRKASIYFDLLLCELQEASVLSDPTTDAAKRMKELIDGDLSQNYTNKDIAERLKISVKTANNTFKKVFGITIHQYSISKKLERAKFHLTYDCQMTLTEISQSLGFCDEYHLSRRFKQAYGISPAAFRKKVATEEFISCR